VESLSQSGGTIRGKFKEIHENPLFQRKEVNFALMTKVVIHTPEPETVSEAFTKPYERYSEAESHG
jgi:hypothetical protein